LIFSTIATSFNVRVHVLLQFVNSLSIPYNTFTCLELEGKKEHPEKKNLSKLKIE